MKCWEDRMRAGDKDIRWCSGHERPMVECEVDMIKKENKRLKKLNEAHQFTWLREHNHHEEEIQAYINECQRLEKDVEQLKKSLRQFQADNFIKSNTIAELINRIENPKKYEGTLQFNTKTDCRHFHSNHTGLTVCRFYGLFHCKNCKVYEQIIPV